METQYLINAAMISSSSVLGWFAREMWEAVKELKTQLTTMREELPRDYVAWDHYREDFRDIKGMLAKIFDKLDQKQDK